MIAELQSWARTAQQIALIDWFGRLGAAIANN